jgi:hypothetical protein
VAKLCRSASAHCSISIRDADLLVKTHEPDEGEAERRKEESQNPEDEGMFRIWCWHWYRAHGWKGLGLPERS